jgi:hypothetical protein
MYYYKFGYTSHEDSDYEILSHEKKFTQNDIKQFFINACCEVYPEIYNRWKKHRANSSKDNEGFIRDNIQFHTALSESKFWEYLKKEGFKSIDIEEGVTVWGWSSMSIQGDWGHVCDKVTIEIQNKIMKKLNIKKLKKEKK